MIKNHYFRSDIREFLSAIARFRTDKELADWFRDLVLSLDDDNENCDNILASKMIKEANNFRAGKVLGAEKTNRKKAEKREKLAQETKNSTLSVRIANAEASPETETETEISKESFSNEKEKKSPQNKRRDDSRIEEIYKAYPLHVAKQNAFKAIEKALKIVDATYLLDKVLQYRECASNWHESERKYIPHPSSWFNGHRWEDDPNTWVKREQPSMEPIKSFKEKEREEFEDLLESCGGRDRFGLKSRENNQKKIIDAQLTIIKDEL